MPKFNFRYNLSFVHDISIEAENLKEALSKFKDEDVIQSFANSFPRDLSDGVVSLELVTDDRHNVFDYSDLEDFILSFDHLDILEIEEALINNGFKVYWTDEGISDGCPDGCGDNYVMYKSCDITTPDGSTKWVTFYYGDRTRIVVDFRIVD